MNKVVLVTGAGGFIGSALVRKLSSQGISVVAVDGLLGGLYPADEKTARFNDLKNLPGVQALVLDLRTDDLDRIPANVTHVINEAAMPGLSLSWSDFDLYNSCNLGLVSRLIAQTKKWDLQKFIQISTSSVYGQNAVGDESQPKKPVSPYGVTKLAAENLALAHFYDSGFPVTILRYFSVYGPGQRPDMAYRKFISRALSGENIELYGTGEQSRSNTYIDDCVDVTISSLELGQPGEAYNIAGSAENSINDALDIISLHVGKKLNITRKPGARGDQNRTFGDTSKAMSVLNLRSTVSLSEGLRKEIDWLKNQNIA